MILVLTEWFDNCLWVASEAKFNSVFVILFLPRMKDKGQIFVFHSSQEGNNKHTGE